MKKIRTISIRIALAILFTNLPIVSEILSLIFYAVVAPPFCFTTKDTQFSDCGGINLIKQSADYTLYKRKYPNADHTLYRYNREREWKYFFMWRIYLTTPEWQAPFIDTGGKLGPG